MEKRRRTRVGFSTQVILTTKDNSEFTATVIDLSLNGVYLDIQDDIPMGTLCDVKIILPGGIDGMALLMEGEVCRKDPKGMGIRFLSMDPDTFSHLKNIAMYNAPDPDAIEHEIVHIPLR